MFEADYSIFAGCTIPRAAPYAWPLLSCSAVTGADEVMWERANFLYTLYTYPIYTANI